MGTIAIRSLSKSYPWGESRLRVLRDVDLEVETGGFAVVSGPSGSGKSTLLNLIGGLDLPDSGSVRIDGADLKGCSDRALARLRNEKIGFVFQSFHLIPVLSAVENVAWPLFLKGVGGRRRMARARKLLTRVGLAEHMQRTPGRLSGGQRQRVAIARALACAPGILLADEPTGNLDRKTAREIMELLVSLNRESGVTFVFATHDSLVRSCAARHLCLVDGKVREEKPDAAEQEAFAHA